MAGRAQYEELIRQFSAFGAVKRELGRILPADCPSGSAAVLTLLGRYGDMHMSRLTDLLAVDVSVTSRHVAHVAERGWIARSPDPADRRSRIVRLTAEGRQQLEALSARTTQLLAERLDDWSDEEVAQLIRLMTRLRASFDDCRPIPHRPPPAPGPVHEPEPDPTTRTPAHTRT
ncbi:MarR family winged helix-turn-helix transcriptional regulator [Streptomyces sp. MS06]|uniref:MarR family winged helix-turn-helix transcriptional regulator n=1 Tax=Streptomyces sp. MS06 TaxID=3385974 RepID=UPI00399F8710